MKTQPPRTAVATEGIARSYTGLNGDLSQVQDRDHIPSTRPRPHSQQLFFQPLMHWMTEPPVTHGNGVRAARTANTHLL